jgi:DNA-binding transcriptional LysR family regulator
MDMNLRHLRTFVLIADSGGIAKAGGRLHLSQPAASRQILALEQELGVQLFARVGRRFRLTSDGEDLLGRCRSLLTDADSINERARALKRGQAGILKVGATPQVIEALFAAFVPVFRRRHPGVEIDLVEDASGRLPIMLERGEVHVAQMPAGDERFASRLLYPTLALAVMPKTHKLARRATLDIAQLADEPLLLLTRASQARGWIDAAFGIVHIRPMVRMESAVPHTLIALAGSGHGIAVIPSNMLVPLTGVRVLPLMLRGAPIGRWSAVCWDAQRYLAPYAQDFIDELVAYGRRSNPGRAVIKRAPLLQPPKAAGGTTATSYRASGNSGRPSHRRIQETRLAV